MIPPVQSPTELAKAQQEQAPAFTRLPPELIDKLCCELPLADDLERFGRVSKPARAGSLRDALWQPHTRNVPNKPAGLSDYDFYRERRNIVARSIKGEPCAVRALFQPSADDASRFLHEVQNGLLLRKPRNENQVVDGMAYKLSASSGAWIGFPNAVVATLGDKFRVLLAKDKLIASDDGSDEVFVLDAASGQQLARISAGAAALWVAAADDTSLRTINQDCRYLRYDADYQVVVDKDVPFWAFLGAQYSARGCLAAVNPLSHTLHVWAGADDANEQFDQAGAETARTLGEALKLLAAHGFTDAQALALAKELDCSLVAVHDTLVVKHEPLASAERNALSIRGLHDNVEKLRVPLEKGAELGAVFSVGERFIVVTQGSSLLIVDTETPTCRRLETTRQASGPEDAAALPLLDRWALVGTASGLEIIDVVAGKAVARLEGPASATRVFKVSPFEFFTLEESGTRPALWDLSLPAR